MHEAEKLSLDQIEAFLKASEEIRFQGETRELHQGDQPGAKGAYHINAVDEVTQWQIVAATAHISEAWLEPVGFGFKKSLV